MKLFLKLFLLTIILSSIATAQPELPDYSKLPSVVKRPNALIPTPNGIMSTITTINGYDNFFLGVDFGEPHIVANPNDPLNAVCAFNINDLYYTLNGVDWTKNTPGFGSYGVVGDPVLAYDSLGVLYYTTLIESPTYGLVTVKSTNKGVSWSAPYLIYGTTVGLSDKEWIVCDQTAGPNSNNVYAGWRQFGSSGMRFTRSTNGGVSWSTPTYLAGDQGAYIAVGPNGSIPGGNVYFANTLGGYIAFHRSTDGGQTFAAYVLATPYINGPGTICYGRYTVKNCIRCDYFPRMAADNSYGPNRGNVYIVYASNPNSGLDKADVRLVRSTDYGTTWSLPIRVNDDNTETDQWMPAINVDNSGKVIVTWYDSRIDPTSNLMTQLYSAVSTNGGVSFMPNKPVSNTSFNPNNMAVGQGSGQANYIGDYIGNNPVKGNYTSWHVWMDARQNSLGSYVGYYPDFAMTTGQTAGFIGNNDSITTVIKIPEIKGPYNDRVRFTAVLDSTPASGSINFSFVNGKDSISAFPDSVYLKIKTIGTVTPKLYKVTISGKGVTGAPVHKRTYNLYVNSSQLSVGTNRDGITKVKVNGVQYSTRTNFVFPNSSNVTVQAVSPEVTGGTRYVYTNWSNSGDTTQNIIINGNLTLTAFYKTQYRLIINSTVGNTFGGNEYSDSAVNKTFGVLSKLINYNGTTYRFRGWTGAGNGAYTSPDSTGNDSTVTVQLYNAIVENARWTPVVGINLLSAEVPVEYKLGQNYPNPFNPSTSINWQIPNSGFTKIVIFDIMGREVDVVINEVLQPGYYSVSYDASKLSSGVYFYKISSGDFSDIKRFVVLK